MQKAEQATARQGFSAWDREGMAEFVKPKIATYIKKPHSAGM